MGRSCLPKLLSWPIIRKTGIVDGTVEAALSTSDTPMRAELARLAGSVHASRFGRVVLEELPSLPKTPTARPLVVTV